MRQPKVALYGQGAAEGLEVPELTGRVVRLLSPCVTQLEGHEALSRCMITLN